MLRVVRSELARLKSPYFLLGAIGLMAILGVMATTIIFTTADSGALVGAPGVKGVTVDAIEAPGGMFAGLQSAGTILGIVMLVIWAISVTSDYSTGLIRLLVQAEPSRTRLLLGKVIALSVLTCAATLVTTLVVLPASGAIAKAADISTSAWSTDMVRHVLDGYLQLTLSALLWGIVGLFVGMITRSSGVAIGVGIGYLLVFEGLLSLVMRSGSKWLPGFSFSAIASGGTPDMSFGTALLVAAAYLVVAFAVAIVSFRRRDITA